jgi:protein TonB
MNSSKILQSDFLDLLFENRNKEYGAYELRRTYDSRVKKSLVITGLLVGLAFGGTALAGAFSGKHDDHLQVREVTLAAADDKKPEPEKIPEKKPEQQQVKTEKVLPPVIAEDNLVTEPPPSQDDISKARIDNFKQDGIDDPEGPAPEKIDNHTEIIEQRKDPEPDIYTDVQVPAKFNGNWIRFLETNLNANVPVDNSAPAGRYSVIIRFVVDKDGNVSDLAPVTNMGYGMEAEAIRALKKTSQQWQPAIQNDHKVKAYYQQTITFVVEEGS